MKKFLAKQSINILATASVIVTKHWTNIFSLQEAQQRLVVPMRSCLLLDDGGDHTGADSPVSLTQCESLADLERDVTLEGQGEFGVISWHHHFLSLWREMILEAYTSWSRTFIWFHHNQNSSIQQKPKVLVQKPWVTFCVHTWTWTHSNIWTWIWMLRTASIHWYNISNASKPLMQSRKIDQRNDVSTHLWELHGYIDVGCSGIHLWGVVIDEGSVSASFSFLQYVHLQRTDKLCQ